MGTIYATDVEKKFFDTFKLSKPVMKLWSYEGYYEDYDWVSRFEDCSALLKRNKYTIEEFNDIIQKAKAEEKEKGSDLYDYRISSVRTDVGMVEYACMMYPCVTDKTLLELICIAHSNPVITFVSRNVKDLKQEVLEVLTNWSENKEIKKGIKKVFKRLENSEND